MDKDIEKPKPGREYELLPIEGIRCKERGCYSTKVEEKNGCNYFACPYSNDGDDGFF